MASSADLRASDALLARSPWRASSEEAFLAYTLCPCQRKHTARSERQNAKRNGAVQLSSASVQTRQLLRRRETRPTQLQRSVRTDETHAASNQAATGSGS
eukprot:2239984-Rhodomonas_salina.2